MSAHPSETWLLGLLREIGSQQRGTKFQCPGHGRVGDHATSLAVGTRRDGRGAWVECHGGCSVGYVLHSVKLLQWHLQTPPNVTPEKYVRLCKIEKGFEPPKDPEGTPRELGYRFEAYHPYGDRARKERLRHPQTQKKIMQWESRNDHGEWVPGLLGTREIDLPLYRERDVLQGMAAGEPILIMESESSVDSIKDWYCTTWAGGASSPPVVRIHRVLGEHRPVVIIPDNDEAGLACRDKLINALPLAEVRIGGPGEDAKDVYLRLGPREFRKWVRGPR